MIQVLCICLGNICRSPLAEGILQHHASKNGLNDVLAFDSAGIGDWHIGSPPDDRSISTAFKHGIDLSKQRARQITSADFYEFNLMLAMDSQNLEDLISLKPDDSKCKLEKFLKFSGEGDLDVPDPYYGNSDDFDQVFSMLDSSAPRIIERLCNSNAAS